MLREQPTADPDLAEVAETPSPACAQDNESDGEQPRSPRRPRARLPSRLLGGNDATRRDTAKGGKKAAKNSPHAASPTRLAGFSTLRRLRAARPATPHAPKTVNCWAAARGPYSRRSLVLKGLEGHVYALAALDGGRLASSSGDNFVIIWNLADGAQLAKLFSQLSTKTKVFVAAWALCEVLNFYTHLHLASLRSDGSREAKIPTAWPFRRVCSPNYSFEIGSWIFYSLATASPAASAG